MEGMKKFLLFVVVFVYILSPIDLCPGPIDDVIVAILGLSKCRQLSTE